MTAPPLVSVIIVNYNGGELLTECVRLVLASTIPVMVYVVDNASTDHSLLHLQQTLGADQRLHITSNSVNLGFAKAANQAVPTAPGEYLLFLNPDCLIRPDTLARFVTTMAHYPQAGMAGCLVQNIDGTEQPGCRRRVPTPWRTIVRILHLDRLFPNHPAVQSFVLTSQPLPVAPVALEGISGACMFVRRTALAEVGLMDEAYFLHCEDLDWFMRFRAQHWEILFIPEIAVTHVKGVCSQGQPIRVLWYKHRGMVRFYRKFFRRQYPRFLLWGVILAVWLRFVLLATVTTTVNHWRKR